MEGGGVTPPIFLIFVGKTQKSLQKATLVGSSNSDYQSNN